MASGDAAADERDAPLPIGATMQSWAERAIARLPGDRDRATAIEGLVRRIQARVNDPLLRAAPTRRVATAVVYGHLPEQELDGILLWIDEARAARTIRATPSACFIKAAKNAFRRHAIEWPNGPKPR